MCQQQIQGAIKRVSGGQTKIPAQQIAHRAVFIPMPVQTPFAARINQPVSDQRLKNQVPRRAFAAGTEPLPPEPVQTELAVKLARPPARAPLPGTVQFQFVRRTPTMFPSPACGARSSGNRAMVRAFGCPASRMSMVLRQASSWLELISPR